MTHRHFVAWALVACSFLLHAPFARASGQNVLINGSFEEGGDPSNPDAPVGWSRNTWTPGASLTWESVVARDEFRNP